MASTFEEIRQRWLPEIEQRIAASGAPAGLVGAMCRYHLATGGKRLRALLPLWICENLGGNPQYALEFGVGLELLHNATLVHDDIQDGDTFRRGAVTVWKQWGAAQAINAGDALIFRAMRQFALAPAASHVLPLVCERMAELIEGQAMDMQLHLPERDPERIVPSLEVYMNMARRKTGALFALCFQLGACVTAVEAHWQIHAAEFGYLVGLIFQAHDDLIEFVGDKGRAPGGDLLAGKMSFPVLWAYEHASVSDVAFLRHVVLCGRETTSRALLHEAMQVLKRCGALDATKEWLMVAKNEALRSEMAKLVPGLVGELMAGIVGDGEATRRYGQELQHDAA